MALKDELKSAIEEERQGSLRYAEWSRAAGEAGFANIAEVLSGFCEDEYKHFAALQEAVTYLEQFEPEEIQLGEKMVEVDISKGRPFPKTYSDWVGLAEDIKARYPDDPVMRASVNFQLEQIFHEDIEIPEQREERLAAAQVAKRWMTEQAGELGIK